MEEPAAAVVSETASAAMQAAQTPKQAVSLATKPQSLPSQEAETEVTALLLGRVLVVALLAYRAAALVRQFLAVRQAAALSPYQVLRLVVTAAPPAQAQPVLVHLLA
jgi:hypothetical protein